MTPTRNQDAVEVIGGTDNISASDRRSKQLLEGMAEDVQSVQLTMIQLQVSRRAYLAVLAVNYKAERALPRKKG